MDDSFNVVVVPDDERREARLAQGVPAPMADALLGMHRAACRWDSGAVGPTLGPLLGRRPHIMRDVLVGTLVPAGPA